MQRVFSLLVLAACGSAKVNQSSAIPATYAVASVAALPTCDSTTRGQVFFVEADKGFVVCHDDGWDHIDLRGPQGASGKDGATGASGKDGAAGKDWSATGLFSSSIHCGGQLGTTGVWFSYDAALLKSGDVLANGSVYGGAFEISQTAFYASTQVGAATASVIFQDDLQGSFNGGWWTLSLNRTTLVTTILYQDADASGGSTTWTMAPDKCVANTYP